MNLSQLLKQRKTFLSKYYTKNEKTNNLKIQTDVNLVNTPDYKSQITNKRNHKIFAVESVKKIYMELKLSKKSLSKNYV